MKFIKGLQTDSNEQDQPENSYVWALNWVANAKLSSLVSERGFTKKFTLPGDLQPIGIMPTSDKVVIFSTNGGDPTIPGANKSEIGIYDDVLETYTPTLNDDIVSTQLGGTVTGLNFSLQHQIKAIYRYNSKNELEVAFTDWYNPPRVMYLGDTNTMKFYYSNYDPNKIRIFQTAKLGAPTSTIGATIETSGSLTADTYFVFYRYKNIDLTTTNAYVKPEPLYVIQHSTFENYPDITGNDIGIITNKSIRVSLGGSIDTSFPFMEVGLYQVSTASAVIVATVPTSQSEITLTSFTGETVLPAEIIAEKVNYTKAKTLTSLNDQLMLGNLEKATRIIPQKYINGLTPIWSCTFIDPAAGKESKDYNKQVKSFCAGEVYSIMVRFLLSDGTYTQWQHIPGRKAKYTTHKQRQVSSVNTYAAPAGHYTLLNTIGSSLFYDKDNIPALSDYSNYTSVGTNNKYFHTTDTCEVTLNVPYLQPEGYMTEYLEGTFGYWENENEQYSQYFKDSDLEIWDNTGMIGNLAQTTGLGAGTTVRHHKFPSLHFLELVTTDETNFTKKFPQLGVRIPQLFDLSFFNSILQQQAPNLTIRTYEVGFSARDFSNCTVYAQDLSLFGCYIQRTKNPFDPGGLYNSVYQSAISYKDAIYFTGSNSVVSALSFVSSRTSFDGAGNITNDDNFAPVENFSHNPLDIVNPINANVQIPNRQRFHTPDLVDPLDPSKDPLITPSYVRHEVMMVCGDAIQTNIESSVKALYTTESLDTDLTSNSSYSLIDYCHSNSNNNTNLDESQYKAFCLKNTHTPWVHRNIKGSGYVPKKTRTVVIGDNPVINCQFNINTGGGDLYGGSDHFHVQLFDKYFDRTSIGDQAEGYAGVNHTHEVMALYKSFLTDISYSGAGQATSTDSNTTQYYNRHPIPSLNFSRTRSGANGIRQHHSAFLCSLVKQTKTIYDNFTNIQVVEALRSYANVFTFLGDCFISEVNYTTHGWGDPIVVDPTLSNPYVSQNFVGFRFYAHTRKNMDYRFEKDNEPGIINKYYPASRWNVNVVIFGSGGQVTNTEIFYKETGNSDVTDKNHSYQDFNYNSVYGFQPIFTRIGNVYSNNVLTNSLNSFPFRVHSSEKQSKESLLNNWRIFLPLNYHENDKTKGEITNLQGYDDQLLIHTIQSLFITRDRGNLQNTVGGITIGTGGLFDFPPKEAIFDNLGYTGTQHQFGCAMTKLGYVFPDAQQGKYFIYNKDTGMIELSQNGLFNYFKTYGRCMHNDYSPFPGTTTPTRSSGLSSWNACYDEFNNRLIIGFNHKLVADPNSYTLSYSDSFKSFTSFHSYIPDLICNTRKNVYSFKGQDFYKHNTPNRNYYLTDPPEQQEIDLVYNTCMIQTQNGTVEAGRDYTKLWQSFHWLSRVHNYANTGVFNLETFTQASVRTDKQCSQLIDLVPFSSTRIYDNTWYFNRFRDKLNRTGIRYETYAPFITSLNQGYQITYPGTTDFDTRFVDNYAILRLIYLPTSPDRELHLIQADYTNKIVKK